MMSRSIQCATNLPPFTLMQNFILTLASIFTGTLSSRSKILLLFTKDDSVVDRWVENEEYIKGKLLDTQGNVQKNYVLKRKSFVQNDLKPLYGLQLEDIHFLADLVEKKKYL